MPNKHYEASERLSQGMRWKRLTGASRRGEAVLCLLCGLMALCSPLIGATSSRDKADATVCAARVLDAQGKPVAGAQVGLYEITDNGWARPATAKLLEEKRTGPEGTFEFTAVGGADDPQARQIVIRKEGRVIAWIAWSTDETRKCDIIVGQTKELAGVVVDEDGEPIVGAEVAIYSAFITRTEDWWDVLDGEVSVFPAVKTDAEGRFVFGDMPAEATFDLRVRKAGRAALRLCDASPSGGKGLFSPGQADIRITLPPEARIEGAVVEKAGDRPVAGVGVILFSESPEFENVEPVVSAQDGRFRIGGLPPGSYSVHLATYVDAMAEWVAEPVDVNLAAGRTAEGIRIELTKGAIIETIVREDGTGEPIEGAEVWADCLRYGESAMAETDKAGVAKFRVLPRESGYGESYACKEGYSLCFQPWQIGVKEGQTERFEYVLTPESKLAGTVRDPSGKPLAGVGLVILPSAFDEFDATTDPNGRFEITWDAASFETEDPNRLLIATAAQQDLAAVVTIGPKTREIDIRLQQGVSLTGRVVDQEGKPIAGAHVLALRTFSVVPSDLWEVVTGQDGFFRIAALPVMPQYEVYVCADRYGDADTAIDGSGIRDCRLDVGAIKLSPANLSVSGVAVDLDGKPVAGARIISSGPGQPHNLASSDLRTDGEGKFVVEGVCAGPLRLLIFTRGEHPAYGGIETEGGARDVRVVVSKSGEEGEFVPRKPPSLVGRPLPALTDVGIELPADANDRMILACLFDMSQRPSRQCVSELSSRAASLAEKGITVAVIQAADAEPEAVREWAKASGVRFTVGCVRNDAETMRFEWGTTSLPHLILTDKKRIVVAEGFELLSELDRRIEEAAGR